MIGVGYPGVVNKKFFLEMLCDHETSETRYCWWMICEEWNIDWLAIQAPM